MLLAVYSLVVGLFTIDVYIMYNDAAAVAGSVGSRLFLHATMLVLLIMMGAGIVRERRRVDRITAQEASGSRVLDSLIRHSPAAITLIDTDHKLEYVSEKLLQGIGYTQSTAGKKCYEVLANGKLCTGCPAEKTFKTGQVHTLRGRAPVPTDQEVYIAQTTIPVFADDGSVCRVLEIAVPITNEVLLEKENNALYMQTAEALSRLIEERDTYTKEHSIGVREWAIRIGRKLKLKADDIQALKVAATLHDIGKIGIPEAILNKPGRLTREEYAVIQRHSSIGYNALKDIGRFKDVAEYVLYHHEKYDGTGYPDGLSGEDIPLLSRILAVADVYEAITSNRVYRQAMSAEQAMETIVAGRGSQFDPQVVDAFLKALGEGDRARKMA
jgi:PAS domain-containing protein